MAIRSRLKKVAEGYPVPKFLGYCLRFGDVYAAFASAKMQVASRSCKPDGVKGPGDARITFYTKAALEVEFLDRQTQNHNHDYLLPVLEEWPTRKSMLEAMPHRLLPSE